MTPRKGQPSALRPDDIELREDGVAQKIAVLQGGELSPQTKPVEVNLLFANMRGVVDARTFKLNFGALDDHERLSIAVWAVSDRLVRLTPPTRDEARLERVRNGLMQIWSVNTRKNAAPLFGAISTIVQESARGRTNVDRRIVVISNGQFSVSEPGASDAIRAAKAAGIAIFPVLLRNGSTADQMETAADNFDRDGAYRVWAYDNSTTVGHLGRPMEDFESMAKGTEGRLLNLVFRPPSGNTLDLIFKWLKDQIRFEYVAGYYPASTAERKERKIQVILKDYTRGQVFLNTIAVER